MISLFSFANSLEASWHAADIDGPLPLSSKYRDSLKSLCEVVKTGKNIPKDIENDSETMLKLSKLCKKLSDEENQSFSSPSYSNLTKSAFTIVSIVFGCVYLYKYYPQYRPRFSSIFSFLVNKTGRSATNENNPTLVSTISSDVREARLKRFAV